MNHVPFHFPFSAGKKGMKEDDDSTEQTSLALLASFMALARIFH